MRNGEGKGLEWRITAELQKRGRGNEYKVREKNARRGTRGQREMERLEFHGRRKET